MRLRKQITTGFIALLLSVSARGAVTSAQPGDWPMFRGQPSLTGVAKGELPTKLSLLWTFKTKGPVKSSAAIVGNKVYIGSGDKQVYAINLNDGKQAWSFATEGPVDSSPLVLGTMVYVGSSDTYLYALNAENGKLVWKYQTGDKILGAPN
ncbi:MAG TPA: PQQ-binding-like beta-propeller repeat protein, partial [Candidatus Saccharimonadales bacterium]|nr:PQQ-binding-like beta-propeller repeat protein [Candidatus Saccharimonadales bacterium]